MSEEKRVSEAPGMPPRFLPLPLAVVDEWLPALTGSQLKLLLVVARQTLGFRDPATGGRRAEDWLTHRQLMRRTGCASQAVSGAVDALVRRGLVRVRGEAGEALDTPQARRRAAGRLLYALGPALLPDGPGGDGPPPIRPAERGLGDGTLKTGHRKSKTTKETRDNNNSLVVFENRKAGERRAGAEWVWRKHDRRWVRADPPPPEVA